MNRKIMTLLAVAALFSMTAPSASFAGDNGNGTVTANGLVWLKDASCMQGPINWHDATAKAASLASGSCGLSDKSTAGQWRLPSKAELTAISSQISLFNNLNGKYIWSSTEINNATAAIVRVGNPESFFIKKNLSSYQSSTTIKTFNGWAVRSAP